MRGLFSLFRRFRDDERGVFAVFFGLFAIVLIAMAGCVVDYTNLELSRTKAQQALDAAALGLAPTIYDADVDEDGVKDQAQNLVTERVADSSVQIEVTGADIDKPNGRLQLSGRITVPMAFVQLVGIPSVTATLVSEVTKGSINLEVAVALDNTGSMADYIDDLKTGLDGLIGIVVKDEQEPTYSKMAIAPYSAAVDAGKYADTVRGAIVPVNKITRIAWWDSTTVKISGISKAKPAVVTTSTAQTWVTGDRIWITGASGMTDINDKFYKITRKTSTTFSLQTTSGSNVDSSDYDKWTKNGTIYHCTVNTCEAVATSADHNLITGDLARFYSIDKDPYKTLNVPADSTVSSRDALSNDQHAVTKLDKDHFKIDGVTSSNLTAATAGDAYCTRYGCKYYYFSKSSRTKYTYKATTSCVTERDPHSYDDAAPTTTKLSINYSEKGACDLDEPIVPLTSKKDVLYAASAKMDDHGSTAGHLGTAWGWYLVSPDWGYVWNDDDAKPAAYDADNLLKVVILMTDGAYNIQYCNGVSDGTINCDAPDDATSQARELCTNMKLKGIVVYTVGFNIEEDSSEAETMTQCATDETKAFLPTDGAALIEDFRTIGQNISDLRLSR